MNTRTSIVAVFALLIGAIGGVVGTSVWPLALHVPFLATGGVEHVDETHDDEDKSHKADAGTIPFSLEAVKDAGIEIAEASGGELVRTLEVPGEVQLNADHVAHIVPRVAGVVRRVDKTLGNEVRLGEVMAVLESRELAEAKASYMATKERLSLAQATFKTSEELKVKKILPELDFLNASRQLAEGEIELRVADSKLHSLGLTEEEIAAVPHEDGSFATYELRAPFSGTVIQKHITLGESVHADSDVFMLADLSSVWLSFSVYGQDIARVRVGQPVRVHADGIASVAAGEVTYVSPTIDEATRTATVRVVLPNEANQWKPGLFVRGEIIITKEPVALLLPADAVQMVEGQPVVFVATDGAFEPRAVKLGRKNSTQVEIVSGLKPGERVVVKNAFIVKSQAMKSELGEE